jgi:putative ABC transport system permease protein
MVMFLKLLRESFVFALHEIAVNKVRTILTLLGITIGIFSIISVFTVFDSLKIQISNSINSLGSDVIFVQKWPWSSEGEYPWWKYINRPEPSLDDLREIQKRSRAAQFAAYMAGVTRTVKFANNSIDNVEIVAVSEDYDEVMNLEIGEGRYISPTEFISGKHVAVLGQDIADNLFAGAEPLGKRIKVFGSRMEVIGIMPKEGDDLFGNSADNQVIIPVKLARNYMDLRNVGGASIIVKARQYVSLDELKDEMAGIMRSVRRLKPRVEDDFALNQVDLISRNFEEFFSQIRWIGWILGGFSLLVGGFGIANIMFVSVKERTHIIGIQMATGAKRYFILLQFLFEAVFLSLFGGLTGLLLVFTLTRIFSGLIGMELLMTPMNIFIGVTVSVVIGLVSGFIPALNASRLDPVEAIRTTF